MNLWITTQVITGSWWICTGFSYGDLWEKDPITEILYTSGQSNYGVIGGDLSAIWQYIQHYTDIAPITQSEGNLERLTLIVKTYTTTD